MISAKHREMLDDVCLFCKEANKGFVFIECNNQFFIKNIEDYLFDNLLSYVYINDKNSYDYVFNNFKECDKNKIFILSHIENEFENVTTFVNKLNYSREFYISTNSVFIFILPTYVIDNLMTIAANFYSCVSLHKKISVTIPCINDLQIAIDNSTMINSSNICNMYRKYRQEYRRSSEKHSKFICSKCLVKNNCKKDFKLEECIGKLSSDEFYGIQSLREYAMFLTANNIYSEAITVYEHLLYLLKDKPDFISLYIDMYKKLADIYYYNHDYKMALDKYYILFTEYIKEHPEFMGDLPSYLNDMAATYFKMQKYNIVTQYIQMIEIEDRSPKISSVLLYNNSIIQYTLLPNNFDCISSIDKAISILEEYKNIYFLELTRLEILGCFFKAVNGMVVDEDNIRETLAEQKKVLSVDNRVVIETYYVLCIYYFQIGEIHKALEINDILLSLVGYKNSDRLHSIILGIRAIVLYYNNKPLEAHKTLNKAVKIYKRYAGKDYVTSVFFEEAEEIIKNIDL